MSISELQKRAMEIRRKYEALERAKYGREWTNQELTLGFVGDVGDLVKLIQAVEGVRDISDAKVKLEHELADCLWSVLVIAEKYGLNMEEAFLKTMDELETRIEKS